MKGNGLAHRITRFAIQIVFFVFLPALFSVAFNGVKYLAERISVREMIVWNPFLATLAALVAFTIVFGRFFCGYACAFGSLGDWIFACSAFARKKTGKKPFKFPDKAISASLYLKYLILVGIVIACLLGLYPSISQADPWGLFASFRAGDFSLGGKMWSVAALGLIVVGMAFIERFFCMFLCPLGAVFAILPMLPLMIFSREKDECIKGCFRCTQTCPAAISLGEKDSKHGDCFQCGKCSVACPKGNVRLGFRKLKGTKVWLPILKAAALFAVCFPIMNA